jgi:hypothetical protein
MQIAISPLLVSEAETFESVNLVILSRASECEDQSKETFDDHSKPSRSDSQLPKAEGHFCPEEHTRRTVWPASASEHLI